MDITFFEESEECGITVVVGDDTLVFYSDTTTSDLQGMFDAVTTIQEVGGVRVERREGLTEDGYLRVVVRLIFISATGPAIELVVSSDKNCSSVAADFIQLVTTPTYQVGFPDFPQRQTRPFPVTTATATELQTELETLLAYLCTKSSPPNVSI